MNYTATRYVFNESAVREYFSGAYYDLFLVMRGNGIFRCPDTVLPAQQQNLIIFKPGGAAGWNTPVHTARWSLSGYSSPRRRWRFYRMRTPTWKRASTWCRSIR